MDLATLTTCGSLLKILAKTLNANSFEKYYCQNLTTPIILAQQKLFYFSSSFFFFTSPCGVFLNWVLISVVLVQYYACCVYD